MIAQKLTQTVIESHLQWLSLFGLLLFFAVFAGVLVVIFRRGAGEYYQHAQSIPFDSPSLEDLKNE